MIVHIVMFRVSNPNIDQKTLQVKTLKDKLDSLKNQISELLFLETGMNVSTSKSAFDLVLTTHFDSLSSLDTYRNHPAHGKVLDYITEISAELTVVDYEK
jgi:hypothetical protein